MKGEGGGHNSTSIEFELDCNLFPFSLSTDSKNIRVVSERQGEVLPQEQYFLAKNTKDFQNIPPALCYIWAGKGGIFKSRPRIPKFCMGS